MSYKLNKTDGSLLIDLIDGSIDSDSTDLVLVGRNYSGFGEFLNENYVKLLENFANSSAPSSPLTGQLWYDTIKQRLKIYNGDTFNIAGGPVVQATQPTLVEGDQWINNLTKQIFFSDSSGEPTLIGPLYTQQQGISGFEVSTILDTQSRARTVVKLHIGGTLVAVISNVAFAPINGEEIDGISEIKKGFNLVSPLDFKFFGTASSATELIADNGEAKNVSQFLPADDDGVTTGALTISNSAGLTIGQAQNNIQRIQGESVVVENGLLDHDYKIRITSSSADSLLIDAVTIKAATKRIGIFNEAPEYTLDVVGDARISGNLIVDGDTTTINVGEIKVEDKNIELAATSNGSLLIDSEIDNAGIIIKADSGDKQLVWKDTGKNWFSTENLDIALGKTYKINGTTLLTSNSLTPEIETATGLRVIGTLDFLTVDNISIDNNVISTPTSVNLVLTPGGNISVSNKKILDVALPGDISTVEEDTKVYSDANSMYNTPGLATDATNKSYVDTIVASMPVVFSLDVSGLSNTDIADIIEDVYPAASKVEGCYARIHTTEPSNTTVTGIQVTLRDSTEIDNGEVLEVSKRAVDAGGVKNASMVQDISYRNPASGNINITLLRGLKQFQVVGGEWSFNSDLKLPA